MIRSADQESVLVELEEEVACLRQEKEQLDRELAGALEAGRRTGEELGQRNRELSGNNRAAPFIWLLNVPFIVLKLTFCLICSAEGEYQEALRRADQGSGLLED